MTALRKFDVTEISVQTQRNNAGEADLHHGDATEMFTSASLPSASHALMGYAVEAFTSASMPTTSDARTGDAVEAFTSASTPTTSDARTGDAVEAFTSASSPVTAKTTDDGEGCALFTSAS